MNNVGRWIIKNDVNPNLVPHPGVDWYWQSALTGISPREWALSFASEAEANQWLTDNMLTGTPVPG